MKATDYPVDGKSGYSSYDYTVTHAMDVRVHILSLASATVEYQLTASSGNYYKKSTDDPSFWVNQFQPSITKSVEKNGDQVSATINGTYHLTLREKNSGTIVDSYTVNYPVTPITFTPKGTSISSPQTSFYELKPAIDVYLSINPNLDFAVSRPSPFPEPEPTEDEIAFELIKQDVIDKGGFQLPWTQGTNGTLTLEIGGVTDTIDVKAGVHNNFGIGVDEDWDGTFKLNGEEFDVNDFSFSKSGEFTHDWRFDGAKAEENDKNNPTGAKVVANDDGVIVVEYEEEDEQGNITSTQVTYVFDEDSTYTFNGGSINNEVIEPAPSDDVLEDSALSSAVNSIEGTGSSGQGLLDDLDGQTGLDAMRQQRADLHNALNNWLDTDPVQGSSLPRLGNYPVAISMGDFGTLNQNINLAHPAVSAVRGIILFSFTLILFSAFLKKLTI